MPEPNDSIIVGLFITRNALLQRWGTTWSDLLALGGQVDQVNSMLAQNGVVIPPADAYSLNIQPATVMPEVDTPTDPVADTASETTDDQLEEAVQKLISDVGHRTAAQQYCEWLLRSYSVSNPATVRALLGNFTPSLRIYYNRDDTTAIETLRSQIKYWVRKGLTALTYEGGLVGLKPEAIKTEEKETA